MCAALACAVATCAGHFWKWPLPGNWKARLFVLDDHLLKYYEGDESPDQLKGAILLHDATVDVVSPEEADGKEWCFKITPISRKIYYIHASDATERDAWIAAVRNNVRMATCAGPSAAVPGCSEDARDIRNICGADAEVTLADFDLLTLIGRGSYGKVIQVRHKGTGEVYAMKELKKAKVFEKNDPKDLQHTLAERKVLALVNMAEHPFVLGMRFAFHTPSNLYYVLDFCNGGDLYYLLSRVKRFHLKHARFYSAEVLCALRHLHTLGVIYRDLKPDNVLLDGEGHVKLTDFGLSKASATAHTFCGTPIYLAPEIYLRRTYGFEVDWWSLGCVLYELVTGDPAFWGNTVEDVRREVTSARPSFARKEFDGTGIECRQCIEQLLVQAPRDRLGFGTTGGANIASHPFFTEISFDELLARRVAPPVKPSRSAAHDDTRNFHRLLTQSELGDSHTNLAKALKPEQERHFSDFAYSGPPLADAPAASPAPASVEGFVAASTSDEERRFVSVDVADATAADTSVAAASAAAEEAVTPDLTEAHKPALVQTVGCLQPRALSLSLPPARRSSSSRSGPARDSPLPPACTVR